MAFKFGAKEMYLIFAFAKCCWSTDSRVVRLGMHAHRKQRKPLPHKLRSYTSSFCRCPAGFSTYIVQFSNIWFGTVLLCFSNPSNFVAVRSVSLNNMYSQLHKCAVYFTFYLTVHFSKEKKRVGFLVGFSVFFFNKNLVVFFGWVQLHQP